MTTPMRPVGRFTVAHDHPALPGHFPGHPVVPGVVLLDEVAELVLAAHPGHGLGGFPVLRFARPVSPGDVVEVACDGAGFACTVAGAAVLRGTIDLVPE